ncbi:MAG: PIN domain-containing protein [Xanthomonadales bacterium]|nr:PIN domain-containing protein [Xanthomonadales bacterium]
MSAPFFDTNTLAYFASGEVRKADQVEHLLAAGGIISVQVLNELTLVCRRRFGMDWREIGEVLDIIRRCCRVEPLTERTHDLGRRLAERYQLQVYDAMIVAAALSSGAKTLLSEDLHDGLVVERQLTIRNPFRPS